MFDRVIVILKYECIYLLTSLIFTVSILNGLKLFKILISVVVLPCQGLTSILLFEKHITGKLFNACSLHILLLTSFDKPKSSLLKNVYMVAYN